MNFDKYPKSSFARHFFYSILWSVLMYMIMVKINLDSYALSVGFISFVFELRYFLYKNIYMVDKNNFILINEKNFAGILKKKKEISLDKYSGIRNRVSWALGKHCQTELIDSVGGFLPIRVDLNNHKINKESDEFKKEFSAFTGIKDCVDLPFP